MPFIIYVWAKVISHQGTEWSSCRTRIFRIEGVFNADDDKDIVVIKSQSGNRKDIEISGKKLERIGDHVGRFLTVMVAPADIQLMMEGSEERRHF